METKFTPGPWFSNRQRVYWKKPDKDLPIGTLPNGQICTCKSAEDWPECDAEARANARLIATAPELYEALRGAVQEACGTCAMLHVNPETYDFIEKGCPYTEDNEKCDYRNCIKILRKARGEE